MLFCALSRGVRPLAPAALCNFPVSPGVASIQQQAARRLRLSCWCRAPGIPRALLWADVSAVCVKLRRLEGTAAGRESPLLPYAFQRG